MENSNQQNWTQYRFDKSHNAYVNAYFNVKSLSLKWKYKLPDEIHASPLIYNGVVYIGCTDFYAFEIATRKIKWKFIIDSYFRGAFVNESNIIISSDKTLYCLNHEGKEVWKISIDCKSFIGISSNLIVENGFVYFSTFYSLYSIKIDSLATVWKFEAPSSENFFKSTPIISDGIIYVCTSKNLYALDVLTGSEIYKIKTTHYSIKTPVVKDNYLLFGGIDNQFCCIDKLTGLTIWKSNAENAIHSEPAITDDAVYFGGLKGLNVIDLQTGNLLWRFETGDYITAGPVVFGNCVFFGCIDTHIYALDKNTGQEIWKYKSERGKERGFCASPAVADNMLFIGGMDNQFYVFDIKSED